MVLGEEPVTQMILVAVRVQRMRLAAANGLSRRLQLLNFGL